MGGNIFILKRIINYRKGKNRKTYLQANP